VSLLLSKLNFMRRTIAYSSAKTTLFGGNFVSQSCVLTCFDMKVTVFQVKNIDFIKKPCLQKGWFEAKK
jgi:hypothetical protein